MASVKATRVVPASGSPKHRRLPRSVRALAHWVLAFALVFGMVQSGGRYFYCEAFGLLPYDPCVQASGEAQAENTSGAGVLSETRRDCCEIVTLASMPRAARAADSSVAPASWVAGLPALLRSSPAAAARPASADRDSERWRPPPRSPGDARSKLMVFLI